jgi:hypothetical protein
MGSNPWPPLEWLAGPFFLLSSVSQLFCFPVFSVCYCIWAALVRPSPWLLDEWDLGQAWSSATASSGLLPPCKYDGEGRSSEGINSFVSFLDSLTSVYFSRYMKKLRERKNLDFFCVVRVYSDDIFYERHHAYMRCQYPSLAAMSPLHSYRREESRPLVVTIWNPFSKKEKKEGLVLKPNYWFFQILPLPIRSTFEGSKSLPPTNWCKLGSSIVCVYFACFELSAVSTMTVAVCLQLVDSRRRTVWFFLSLSFDRFGCMLVKPLIQLKWSDSFSW